MSEQLLFVAATGQELAGVKRHRNGCASQVVGVGARKKYLGFTLPLPEHVINVGLCGALDPALEIADIFIATHVNGEPVELPRSHPPAAMGALVTVDHVVLTAAEKRELRARGLAVDMEAAHLLKSARASHQRFYCIRAVSDLAGENLHCDFNRAITAEGQLSKKQIALEAVRKPFTCLPELIRLARRSALASERLGEFLAACQF